MPFAKLPRLAIKAAKKIQKIVYNTENTVPIMLVTNPPVAIPLGNAFLCLTEQTSPTIPDANPKKGTQQRTMLAIPRTKPATPNPLLCAI